MNSLNSGRRAMTLVEVLVVCGIVLVLVGLLLPAVQHVRASALRSECANRLRQLASALHQYHALHGTLPPGMHGRQTKTPYKSWLADMLPYMEQEPLASATASAYASSPDPFENPPHIGMATVVKTYICPADDRIETPQLRRNNTFLVAFTSFMGVSGHGIVLGGRNRFDGVLYVDSRTRYADIVDGMSNTLMFGERPPSSDFEFGWWYAGAGHNGTGTYDFVLGVREEFQGGLGTSCDPDPPGFVPGRLDNLCDVLHFWSLHPNGANFAFCDGSVRFLAYSVDPIMPALATRAGDEAVQIPD